MQNVDIQQLNANLQMLLTKDAVVFVDMVMEILYSDVSKAYFQQMEDAVLKEMVEKNLELKEENDVCILFFINELLQKNENVVEEGTMPYGNKNKDSFSMDYVMIFHQIEKQWHSSKRNKTEKIDMSISESKDINYIKENLQIIAKQNFKSFLNVITCNVFDKEDYFEEVFFFKKREKITFNFLVFLLAIQIDIIDDFIDNRKAKDVYKVSKYFLHRFDNQIKFILETKIELAKAKKRRKQFETFIEEDFQKYDAVYKALS